MELSPKFSIPLSELEAAARVDVRDVVEMVPEEVAPLPDARGEEPDRGWFASGA